MSKLKIGDRVKLKTKGDNPEMVIESFLVDSDGMPLKDMVICSWFNILQDKQTGRFNTNTLILSQ